MKDSHIEWTTHTFNEWEGCSHVSPGCDRCYAEFDCDKRFGRVDWGPEGQRRRVKTTLNAPLKWQKEADHSGKRARVFCSSLSDVFDAHKSIQQEWRDHLWEMIRRTPALDWLLLTKRPQNMKRYLPEDWGNGYPNVCLMVTVEDQKRAEQRIPILLDTPARYKALSVEPMLGPVELDPWITDLSWIITGGESLSGARPMNPNWVRNIRDLCRSHSVPFIFKQWGWWTPERIEGKQRHCFEDDQEVYYRGNKLLNGNLLDGVQHLSHPFEQDYMPVPT